MGVNASGQGFDSGRTQLLFQMLRVFRDVVAEKYKLHYCSENVASMTKENRDRFTGILRVLPTRICSSGICHTRRPRYFWNSWVIPEGLGFLPVGSHLPLRHSRGKRCLFCV